MTLVLLLCPAHAHWKSLSQIVFMYANYYCVEAEENLGATVGDMCHILLDGKLAIRKDPAEVKKRLEETEENWEQLWCKIEQPGE